MNAVMKHQGKKVYNKHTLPIQTKKLYDNSQFLRHYYDNVSEQIRTFIDKAPERTREDNKALYLKIARNQKNDKLKWDFAVGHVRFILFVMKEYYPAYVSDGTIMEALKAVHEAAKHFTTEGTYTQNYLTKYIFGYVLRYIRHNKQQLSPVGISSAKKMYSILREIPIQMLEARERLMSRYSIHPFFQDDDPELPWEQLYPAHIRNILPSLNGPEKEENQAYRESLAEHDHIVSFNDFNELSFKDNSTEEDEAHKYVRDTLECIVMEMAQKYTYRKGTETSFSANLDMYYQLVDIMLSPKNERVERKEKLAKKCKITFARLNQRTLAIKKKFAKYVLSDTQRKEEFRALLAS